MVPEGIIDHLLRLLRLFRKNGSQAKREATLLKAGGLQEVSLS
jgi:hypothetical protein